MENINKQNFLIVVIIICILGTVSLIIMDCLKEKPVPNNRIAYVEDTTTTSSTTTTTTTTTTQVVTTKAVPTTTIKKTTKANIRR